MNTSIVVVDLETDSLSDDAQIIEIGAVALNENFEEYDHFETRVRFNLDIADRKALELNGYSPELWADAPFQPQALGRFLSWLSRHKNMDVVSKAGNPYSVVKMASFNSAFDYPKLKRFAGESFLPVNPKVRCIMQLAFHYLDFYGVKLQSESLSSCCEYFGIVPQGDLHRALTDARCAALVYKRIRVSFAPIRGEVR